MLPPEPAPLPPFTPPGHHRGHVPALAQMGFRQGNILEPSCGVGNFIGMLPDSMTDSKATA